MKKMLFRRVFALLLAAFLTAGLFGCRGKKDGADKDANAAAEPSATESGATEPPATEPPKDESPYKGPREKYVYTTEEGSFEREIEEDILQFANDVLDPYNGHPLLADRECSVGIYEDNTLQGCKTELVNMYDPALREEFIRRINAIILDIPNMESYQDMLIPLAETAAILKDVHTSVSPLGWGELPIEVAPFYTDDGFELRITAVIAGYDLEDVLLARIDAINGVPVEECLQRISKMVSYESETWLRYEVLDGKYGEDCYTYILDTGILRYYGIIEDDEAEIEITDINGEEWVLNLYEEERYSYEKTRYDSGTGAEESDVGIDLMWQNYYEKNEWCKLLSDGETLYFRFFSCVPDDMSVLIGEFDAITAQTDSIKNVIIDFRHNPGGYATLSGYSYDFINRLRALNADTIYVVIDNGSCSAATILPSHLVRVLDNAMLIGMKSAQPTSFFTGVQIRFRNCGWKYGFSKRFSYFWPGNEDDALTPDITVYQTLEDYMLGIDSVINYIVNGGETPPAIQPA